MIIQITNWLYQGDWASVHREEYRKHKIGAIVRVSHLLSIEKSPTLFPTTNVNYLWCPFGDRGEDLTRNKLEVLTNFAWRFGPEGVLVHCQSGQNRSSVVCALLLREILLMTEEEACNLVVRKNNQIAVMAELVRVVRDLVKVDLEWLL